MRRAYKNLLCFILIVSSALAFGGTSVSWMGTTFTIPGSGETDWAGPTKVDGFLVSVGQNALSKAGGNFTLTADTNFGSSYGLLGKYFTDNTASAATSGMLRLSNGASVSWLNAAGSANLPLSVNSSNNLVFNGATIMSSSGIVPVASGGTGMSSVGGSSTVLVSNGTAIEYSQLTNAMVSDGASVTRTKLGVGNPGRVVINSSSGVFSDEATLAVSRGGTNIGSYTTGDVLYASSGSTLSKLAIGSSGQQLTVSGGVPTWGAASASLAVSEKTSGYALTSTDDVIVSNSAGASVTHVLPSASANSGKVFYVVKKDTSGATNIATLGGDTISGSQNVTLGVANQYLGIVSDGSSTYRVTTRGAPSAPTRTAYLSGSGTYTTKPGVLYLKVRAIGGGGGGGGSGTTDGTASTAGGNTTFGTSLLTANGGAGGTRNGAGAAGGSASAASPSYGTAVTGGNGGASSFMSGAVDNGSSSAAGGGGGVSFLGGGAAGGYGKADNVAQAGQAAATNSGSGGGGGSLTVQNSVQSGDGGGAGGYVEAIIPNPSPTYSYSVGSAGTGQAAGTNGAVGGAGAAGQIEIIEYYQ